MCWRDFCKIVFNRRTLSATATVPAADMTSPPPAMDTMVEISPLEIRIEGVLPALKPTSQSSFMGPRVRELDIKQTEHVEGS